MATLVFRSTSGPLIQTQVGAADLVATFHAAHAAYGWLGGLDSVRYLMNIITSKCLLSSTKLGNLHLDNQLSLLPTRVHSFGSDIRTQIIGLTLFALTHELGGEVAVRLFTIHLAPSIFSAPPELLDALQVQLSDKTTFQKIINEGASRGLANLLIEAALSSNLPPGDCGHLKKECTSKDKAFDMNEVCLVGGLVEWIGEKSTTAYFTRSALVARIALYLRTVGYMIGHIKTWGGEGDLPEGLGPNAVVLVLGGSYPTDVLAITDGGFENTLRSLNLVHHYTTKTVGGLLLNALSNLTDVSPERLQGDFDYVWRYLSTNTEAKWSMRQDAPGLCVVYSWKDIPQSSSFEKSIAAVYFPNAGDFIAPCYSRIASESLLKEVRDESIRNEEADGAHNLSTGIARFRAVTACIVLGIVGRLAPDTFTNTQHQTILQLSTPTWLETTCPAVDRLASSHIPLGWAALQLAAIHAGCDPRFTDESKSHSTIGYRSGIFSILLTLLLKMKPTIDAIGFTRSDRFLANLAVSEEGTVEDVESAFMWGISPDVLHLEQHDCSSLTNAREPWTAFPAQGPPDLLMYLSLERPPFSQTFTAVALTARIDGSIIGRVSIQDVLWVLLRISYAVSSCHHSNAKIRVRNIKASHWVQPRGRDRPTGTVEIPGYVSARDDACWAIFLAGESRYLNSVVVDRCVHCAKDLLEVVLTFASFDSQSAVLIGYGN